MTTSTAPLSTVIGVFPDHEQAERAIDELRHTHFSYEHIRVVERGRGGLADTLKGMFTGQATTASSATDDLMKMGLPEYEARHYQQELESGHVLVLMNADDRPEAAFSIMRQNGAFDINSRLMVSSTKGSTTPSGAYGSGTATNENMSSKASDAPPSAPATRPVSSDPDMSPAVDESEKAQATLTPMMPPRLSDPENLAEPTD